MTITEYKERYIKIDSWVKQLDLKNVFGLELGIKLYQEIKQYNNIYRYANFITDIKTAEIMFIIVGDVSIDINNNLNQYRTDSFNLIYNTNFAQRYGTILELYSIDNVIIYYKYHTRGKLKTIKHFSNMSIYTSISTTKKRDWKLKYIVENV